MNIIDNYLEKDNYYGTLVFGAYIQEVVEIFENTLLIPLEPLYHNNFIDYIKDFSAKFNYKLGEQNLETFHKDYSDNIPVCYIICKSDISNLNLSTIDEKYADQINKAKLFLSLISNQTSIGFFNIVKINGKIWYKTQLVEYNKVTRLWINEKEKIDYIKNAEIIVEKYSFSLSLFQDALRESNHLYRIARYFMVLESIVGSSDQSRDHIKAFFLKNNYSTEVNYYDAVNNYTLKIDAITVGGKIRAKLFHGASLKYKYFEKIISKADYDYIIRYPESLSRVMRDLCEEAFFIKARKNKAFSNDQ